MICLSGCGLTEADLGSGKRFSFTGWTERLPVTRGAGNAVVEPQARQHVISQVLDMHQRGEAQTAARAQGGLPRVSRFVIQLHAQLGGALKNMKELSERKKQQRADYRDGVQNRDEAVS